MMETSTIEAIEDRYERAVAAIRKAELDAGLNPDAKSPVVTHRQCAAMLRVMAEELCSTIEPLRARIAELEARPAVKHCGTFAAGRSYAEGNLVTQGGGLWLARQATQAKPGADPSWQLVVKSGGGR